MGFYILKALGECLRELGLNKIRYDLKIEFRMKMFRIFSELKEAMENIISKTQEHMRTEMRKMQAKCQNKNLVM